MLPTEAFEHLVFALICDQPAPAAARAWFIDGAMRAMRHDQPLDHALGLCGPGVRSVRRAMLLAVRDRYLVQAIAAAGLSDGVSTWARCLRVAAVISRASRRPSSAMRAAAPPADWSACDKAVWHAMRTGLALPRTPRALYGVLKRTPPCAFQNKAPTMGGILDLIT